MSDHTLELTGGDLVFPGTDLCVLRPELAGKRGRVESMEGDELLVQWNGHRRLYRVAAIMLEKGT